MRSCGKNPTNRCRNKYKYYHPPFTFRRWIMINAKLSSDSNTVLRMCVYGFVFVIIEVWMCFLLLHQLNLPVSSSVSSSSTRLIILVNLWLSLGAGQWLTTSPVSQTLITMQVTHRPENDWHEMETSLILWAWKLKWNISCRRDGRR